MTRAIKQHSTTERRERAEDVAATLARNVLDMRYKDSGVLTVETTERGIIGAIGVTIAGSALNRESLKVR